MPVCVCVGCQSCSWANGSYAQPRVDTSCGQAKDNMGHRPSFFFQLPTILTSRHSLVFKIELTSLLRMPLQMSSHTRLSQFFLRSRLFFSLHRFSHLPGPGQLLSSALCQPAGTLLLYSVTLFFLRLLTFCPFWSRLISCHKNNS